MHYHFETQHNIVYIHHCKLQEHAHEATLIHLRVHQIGHFKNLDTDTVMTILPTLHLVLNHEALPD